MTRKARIALTVVAAFIGLGQLGARPGGCAPVVKLYGKAGTFGGLTDAEETPSGDSLAIQAVDYGFSPGQSAWFPAVASDGTVFVATMSQRGNALLPTGCTMEIACYNPGARVCRDPDTGSGANFALLKVPNALGGTAYPDAACATTAGGSDLTDIAVLGSGSNERVFFISTLGGFPTAAGWPMSGSVRKINGLWQIDTGSLRSALDYHDSNPPVGSEACLFVPKGCLDSSACAGSPCVDPNVWGVGHCDRSCSFDSQCTVLGPDFVCRGGQCVAAQCRGPGEIDRLPVSGRVVMTHYFGGVSVLDDAGQVLAYHPPPPAPNPCGSGTIVVSPRQVEVDPTSTVDNERFAVVYDTDDPRSYPAQEFRYNEAAGTIEPLTAPFFGTIAWGPQPSCAGPKIGSHVIYDDAGNLIVQRNAPYPTHALVYLKNPSSGKTTAQIRCPSGDWGTLCPADFALGYWNGNQTQPEFNFGWSLGDAFDPVQATMLVPTSNGTVVPLSRFQGGGKTFYTILPQVDLGMGQLPSPGPNVQRSVHKVALDPTRGYLWASIHSRRLCGGENRPPCMPAVSLDSWLYRVAVDPLLAARPRIVDVSSSLVAITGGLRLTVNIATTAKQDIAGSMPNRIFVYRDNVATPLWADMNRTTNSTGHVFSATVDLPSWQSASRVHWYAVLKDVVKGTDPSPPAVVAGVEFR